VRVAEARFVDELPFGFGWIHPKPGYLRRASHALAAEGRVWLFDATDVEGLDGRIRAFGEPAGVIQLFADHERDGKELAGRYGVRAHRLSLGDSPFEAIFLSDRELAAWWPETKTLIVGEAVGTAPFDRTLGERLGPHPAMRLKRPKALLGYEPEHVLVGHGEGLHGPDAADELHRAIRQAAWRAPLLPLSFLPGR
jgi:hypothetical protein